MWEGIHIGEPGVCEGKLERRNLLGRAEVRESLRKSKQIKKESGNLCARAGTAE
jgi:hypothetical protein